MRKRKWEKTAEEMLDLLEETKIQAKQMRKMLDLQSILMAPDSPLLAHSLANMQPVTKMQPGQEASDEFIESPSNN